MSSLFYVSRNGKTEGPYSIPCLQALKRQGIINSATNVCKQGTMKWEPYYTVMSRTECQPILSGSSIVVRSSSGRKTKSKEPFLAMVLMALCVLSVGGGAIMGLVSFIAGFIGLGLGYILGGAVGGVLWYTLFVLLTKK